MRNYFEMKYLLANRMQSLKCIDDFSIYVCSFHGRDKTILNRNEL